MSQTWRETAQETQARRIKSIPSEWLLPQEIVGSINSTANTNVLHIPKECGILSQRERDITENYNATILLEKLRHKEFSSFEVTTAFCKRAAIAQQLVNCCTELLFDSALQRARECDEYLAREGKPLGPLHGLPISLKDLYHVPEARTTAGFVQHALDPPQTRAAGITALLLSLGAVFHVKTNMTQMGFSYDTDNNLFGRTLNPLQTGLTPGGSSGGESALLALRGSILGVGTDSLGSLRTPAHATGLYTIKPSPSRVPYGGFVFNRAGTPGLPLHVGPLAHSVEDLAVFMKSVLESDPWTHDASVTRAPWKDTKPEKSLRLGYITEDPMLPLHPPMLKTMESAADRLKKAGHTIIPLGTNEGFPSLLDAMMLTFRFALMDPKPLGLDAVLSAGEPFVPSVQNAWPSEEARAQYAPSLDALIAANSQRQAMMEQMRNVYVNNQFDAIIMPLHDTVAPPNDTWNTALYIAIWNLLPYPTVMIPVGSAQKDEDASYVRKNVDFKSSYNPDDIEGMPCSIQIVGKPFEDESLLALSAEVQSCLKNVTKN